MLMLSPLLVQAGAFVIQQYNPTHWFTSLSDPNGTVIENVRDFGIHSKNSIS